MKKVKRKRIDWLVVLSKQHNQEMKDYFNKLFWNASDSRHGKRLSINRLAYYTLKHFYSTTTINQLLEKTSV